MIEYTTVRDRTLAGLAENMTELSKRGWQCKFVTKERGVKLKWVALMERPVTVTTMGSIGWKNIGSAKALKAWGDSFNSSGAGEPELPLSERRALAGDPAAYRSADDLKQKEPDPQS